VKPLPTRSSLLLAILVLLLQAITLPMMRTGMVGAGSGTLVCASTGPKWVEADNQIDPAEPNAIDGNHHCPWCSAPSFALLASAAALSRAAPRQPIVAALRRTNPPQHPQVGRWRPPPQAPPRAA
jgi:Protein of unknown function (DUF2946)